MDKESISSKASLAGIGVNIVLCTVKLVSGFLTNSIAILSDGFNNLTDIGNAILIFIGYRIARKPADREHPYGHGRVEYMLSQGIAVMIIVVGLSLLKSSIQRFVDPAPVAFNKLAVIILVISMLAKVALALYYRKLHQESGLIPLKAQVTDSLSDAASTAIIIVGYVLTPLTTPYLDALLGLVLSIIIIINGLGIFMEMTSVLLGQPGSENTYEEVEKILTDYPEIKGIHDLRIHSYGPDIVYGSADIDLEASLTLHEAHDILDAMETEVARKTGIKLTLHADPSDDDQQFARLRQTLADSLREYDSSVGFHDFHFNSRLSKYFVDIVVPYDHQTNKKEISEVVRKALNISADEIEIRFDRN